MDVQAISSTYTVRKLKKSDVNQILEVYESNPLYFDHCPPAATREGIVEDMKALPPGRTDEDKYYIGFFDGEKIIAVMDSIRHYPEQDILWIGLFMMSSEYQGTGIGTKIISEFVAYIKKIGYKSVRLAYVKTNPQAKRFWEKNQFTETGREIEQEAYTVVVLERML